MVKKTYWIRGGILLVSVFVLWTGYISSKQLSRNQRIQAEVNELKNEADKIRRENEMLSEKIGYFSSNDFREQEGKEKLGFKKMNEEVVVIKPRADKEEKGEVKMMDRGITSASENTLLPNYKKWWMLFFEKS